MSPVKLIVWVALTAGWVRPEFGDWRGPVFVVWLLWAIWNLMEACRASGSEY